MHTKHAHGEKKKTLPSFKALATGTYHFANRTSDAIRVATQAATRKPSWHRPWSIATTIEILVNSTQYLPSWSSDYLTLGRSVHSAPM